MEKFQTLRAIQNRDVVDTSGELVGRVHDLLFNMRDGRIEYVCVAVPGIRQEDVCEVIVPWSAVQARSDGRHWVIAAHKRVLQELAQPVSERQRSISS